MLNLLVLIAAAGCLGAGAGHLLLREPRSQNDPGRGLRRAPFPVWAERDGTVIWTNAVCRDVFGRAFAGISALDVATVSSTSDVQVVEITNGDAPSDYLSVLEQIDGDVKFFYGLDANALKETEDELRRFVQTLTTTFAHLPIGLAVFDRTRDLALFNPALSSLLGVPPDWLARRPSLRSFLDRLRNNGALPEPRDYTSLKEEFARLESGAFEGLYEVEWTLSSGRLYRVTGRPHAEGGAALLFEDITHAAAIEAQYQAEMRQFHGALEALSDGIMIFDAAGELAYANDAFDDMWACTLSRSVTPVSITDISKLFQSRCRPNPAFGEMRNFVLDLNERSEWQAVVETLTGTRIRLRFTPISEGRVFCEMHTYDKATGSASDTTNVASLPPHREAAVGAS